MQSQVFNNTDNDAGFPWVCPAGVSQVFAQCIGPGGGGGQQENNGIPGGGGGGGAYAAGWVPVTPGNTYMVMPGTVSNAESNLTSSSFTGDNNTTVSADGGHEGGSGYASSNPGGSGGIAADCTGAFIYAGGAGGAGNGTLTTGGAGGGGAPASSIATGQAGGDGSTSTNTGGLGAGGGGSGGDPAGPNATNGSAPDTGGGGGFGSGGNWGAGAAGQVTLSWCVCNLPVPANATGTCSRTGATFAIYLKPDFDMGQEHGDREVAALTWTHIALVCLGVDLRDAYGPEETVESADTITVGTTTFTVIFVSRINQGSATDMLEVYLDRTSVTWPSNTL